MGLAMLQASYIGFQSKKRNLERGTKCPEFYYQA